MESYSVWPFVPGFFPLSIMFLGFVHTEHVLSTPFLFMAENIPLYEYPRMCLSIQPLMDISKEILKLHISLWIRSYWGTCISAFPSLPSEGPTSSVIHRGIVGSRHSGGNLLFPCQSQPPIQPPWYLPTTHPVTPSSPKAHGNSSDLCTAQEPYCWEVNTVKKCRWGAGGDGFSTC